MRPFSSPLWLSLLLGALLTAAPAQAHELHLQLSSTQASLIQLQYSNGEPMAFEAYELYPGTADAPAQVGRSDAQGRIVFLPGDIREWRLKAFAADGHGVDQRLQISEAGPANMPEAVPPSRELDRFSRLILGISLILGGFGLYQFWRCRNGDTRPNPRADS